jgi:uncharacterized coiled-coil protein SlyX
MEDRRVFKSLSALSSLIGVLIGLVFLAILLGGGWLGLQAYLGVMERDAISAKLAEREAEIEKLNQDLVLKQQEIERLNVALRLLKVDHRVAQIDVLTQHGSAKAGDLVTTISFVELDDKGQPLEKPRVFTVKGDVVYVDALVVKFTDESVEVADPLRSTSSCLFRRIYGEAQQPNEGFVLDPVGSQPVRYRSGEKISEFEKEIWARFWDYSNNPAEAERKGIRAAHGEAPFQKVLRGKRYRVELRSSGGLSFRPEDIPPKSAGQTF